MMSNGHQNYSFRRSEGCGITTDIGCTTNNGKGDLIYSFIWPWLFHSSYSCLCKRKHISHPLGLYSKRYKRATQPSVESLIQPHQLSGSKNTTVSYKRLGTHLSTEITYCYPLCTMSNIYFAITTQGHVIIVDTSLDQWSYGKPFDLFHIVSFLNVGAQRIHRHHMKGTTSWRQHHLKSTNINRTWVSSVNYICRSSPIRHDSIKSSWNDPMSFPWTAQVSIMCAWSTAVNTSHGFTNNALLRWRTTQLRHHVWPASTVPFYKSLCRHPPLPFPWPSTYRMIWQNPSFDATHRLRRNIFNYELDYRRWNIIYSIYHR